MAQGVREMNHYECKHDLAEREIQVADGYCPACLVVALNVSEEKLALAREALREVCAYAILHRPECLHPTTDRCVCGALKAYMKACDVLESNAKLAQAKPS
jgi:hypothetical protein